MRRILLVSFTLVGFGWGQAMVQHAAAAAGGAAAAAGTGKIAEGLGNVLGQAAGAANTAAAAPAPTKKARPSPFDPKSTHMARSSELSPVAVPNGTPLSAPSTGEYEATAPSPRVTSTTKATPFQSVPSIEGGPVVHRTHTGDTPQLAVSTPAEMPTAFAVAVPVVIKPPVPLKVATTEALAAITPGMSYESLVQKLGPPAMRMSSFEDGHLAETLRIEAKGSRLGSVYVVDGLVTSVDLAK
jgi:hypothetical protein